MFQSEDSRRKLTVWVKKIIAYMYLCVCFSLIIQYFGYNLYVDVKSINFVIAITMTILVCYILINHLLIKKTITHKTLIIFEILLLLTLCSQIIANYYIAEYYSSLL